MIQKMRLTKMFNKNDTQNETHKNYSQNQTHKNLTQNETHKNDLQNKTHKKAQVNILQNSGAPPPWQKISQLAKIG